ncbi:hypothetical protein L209DRAFT_296129 [Thermothelomyces heterothallicus CBS 203.75]
MWYENKRTDRGGTESRKHRDRETNRSDRKMTYPISFASLLLGWAILGLVDPLLRTAVDVASGRGQGLVVVRCGIVSEGGKRRAVAAGPAEWSSRGGWSAASDVVRWRRCCVWALRSRYLCRTRPQKRAQIADLVLEQIHRLATTRATLLPAWRRVNQC